MHRGQIHTNVPPEHPIMFLKSVEIKMAAVLVKRSVGQHALRTSWMQTKHAVFSTNKEQNEAKHISHSWHQLHFVPWVLIGFLQYASMLWVVIHVCESCHHFGLDLKCLVWNSYTAQLQVFVMFWSEICYNVLSLLHWAYGGNVSLEWYYHVHYWDLK